MSKEPQYTLSLAITHIDTACCLIEIDGIRILTDPVLDNPGKVYHHGYGAFSRKTSNPSITISSDQIDLILLSHPQHKDNFDTKGREVAKKVPLILSTKRIEKEFTNGKRLRPWETYNYSGKSGRLTVTATPAMHHPRWLPRFFSGEVIGFIIESDQLDGALYISGDTIFFDGIREVAERFKNIGNALIHVGGAEFRYLTGFGKYTMDAIGFIKSVEILNPSIAIPIHNSGWTHFKESNEGIHRVLKRVPKEVAEKVLFLESGERTIL